MGEPELLSKSKGVDCTNMDSMFQAIERAKPNYVWYCVGGGSVSESKRGSPHAEQSLLLNLKAPMFLNDHLDENIKLVVFSSDYVADESRPDASFANVREARSVYAELKRSLELYMLANQRKNTSIIRVGSLYGVHKPENTFPGKIVRNFGFSDTKIKLPSNIVVPTPTRWLAGMLIQHLDQLCPDWGTSIEHVAPTGGITVKDWAMFVLEGLRDSSAFDWGKDFFDLQRPLFSGLNCSLSKEQVHWFDLWKLYYHPDWFTPREFKDQLPEALKYKPKPVIEKEESERL